jgi:hypothetical protein
VRFFFSCGLMKPALRVLLPLLPAAEGGGGRRGGMAAGSGILGGLLRLLCKVGGEFLFTFLLAGASHISRKVSCSWKL